MRGPFGEGEIWLKPDARPVSVPPFHLNGERREALDSLVGECIARKKLEPGKGAWNTPAFPVPKKTPGSYRLVQDLRPQNAATVKDGHPLPRINDMVHRQGKNAVWTVLDLVDGFHQMPLRKDHRHITCMSTPRGSMQWTVQVMGLKNAATQFQRMMEWVLQDLPATDPYIDDSITGSNGPSEEERIWNNYHAVRAQLLKYRELKVVCSAKKSVFFGQEVEFCGHILRKGSRSPAPGKLLPIQLWELPQTVTDLRGFLGLTNYFSEYVEHYAETAAPLMGKLKLNRVDGKKGSKLRLIWTDQEVQAFEELKRKLCKGLELWQPDLDQPFRLQCDASDYAIGAELGQKVDGKWRPVAFYSRKLAKSQVNWAPREKETYAIVAALRKWSGLIGFQPVLVTTDHKSLEDWVTEHVDTPSGPRGRRARWHETLSQFDLEIKYIPGPDNVVPDALSRWAYPASSSREDVSFHGSLEAKEEVRKMLEEELAQGKRVGLVRCVRPGAAEMVVSGPLAVHGPKEAGLRVVTRSKLDTDEVAGEGVQEEGSGGEAPPPEVPPQAAWNRTTRRRRPSPDRVGEGVPEPVGGLNPLAPPFVSQGAPVLSAPPPVLAPAEPVVPASLPLSPPSIPPPQVATPSLRCSVGRRPAAASSRIRGVCPLPPAASAVPLRFQFAVPPPARQVQSGPDLPELVEGGPVDYEEEPRGGVELEESEVNPPVSVNPGGFQFADLPPGARRGGRGCIPPARVARGGPAQFVNASSSSSSPSSGVQGVPDGGVHILDHDWTEFYENCPYFGALWQEARAPDQNWPGEHKVFRSKLYWAEKLCVPDGLVLAVIKAHHEWLGHMGVERSILEVGRRFVFPPYVDPKVVLAEVKKNCLVCQACDRTNWPSKGPIVMTPILDSFMSSVCLDVFSMPVATWQGAHYDAFLLCIDRHSGWVVAKPTQKFGLTGEKAAHLLLDATWGEVGVPSIVTSDQGPQFISQWWQTMCGRLGIRCAYSQAHRPQANGRAEVAGRVIQDVLRKLLIDKDISWVEALPRAIRLLHDTPDPVTHYSPYEIVFGRERALAGLPWSPVRVCPEAEVFFERMAEIDRLVAVALNEAHRKVANQVNSHRRGRPPYVVGDWVWYLRPKGVGGAKLQSWWQGPFRVHERLGESSYRLRTPQGQFFDAHADQLKLCHWVEPEDPITSLQYPPQLQLDGEEE